MNNKTNTIVPFLLLLIAMIGCEKNSADNPNTVNPKPAPTPTPEELIPMTAAEIMQAQKELEVIFDNGFTKCVEEKRERLFSLFGNNLFEIMHYTEYERIKDVEGIWKFEPEDIEQKNKIPDIIPYRGYIVFILFNDKGDTRKNFLFAYDKNNHQWDEIENFDKISLEKNRLPTKVHVRKKKGAWEFKISNKWSKEFPFKKPNIDCKSLKNKKETLKPFSKSVFGITAKKTSSDGVCKTGIGYVNKDEGNLRSSPKFTSKTNKIEVWYKNSKFKILAVVNGEKSISTGYKKWFKVEFIEGKCSRGGFSTCEKRKGYLHSNLITCGS